MRSGNRIAIVGAGIAGLVCAKVLSEDGFAVEVFDRAPDIGGVWSETRRYPGLRAQSSKYTYHFSDHPMPADYPRVLDGARMQEYLASYVRAFGLTERLRLRTEVVAADPVEGGWLLEIRDPDGAHRISCDHLVIANGVFSEPEVPDFVGAAEFARAGGQVGHSTQFLDVEAVRDRSVVVIGYGAAACDLATEISRVAAATTVVARRLLWKMPRRLAPGLDAERVLLTRTGAAHFPHPDPGRFERLLHGPGRSFRDSNLDLVEALVAQRSGAAELGLVPDARFEQAHEAAFGLAPEGFAEQVAAGRITVRGGIRVAGLGGGPAGPFAELSDGERVRADIVVCATGFQQRVPFLTPYVQRQLTDDHGNFRLYRQILPLDVPHLTFAGYNSSLLSAIGAEVGAHWTAALLTGALTLPPAETMSERIDSRLRWMQERTGGRHAHGAAVTPYAIRDIDELLADLGVTLPWSARAAQWVRPVRPGDYRAVSRRKRGTAGQGLRGGLAAAPVSPATPQPAPEPEPGAHPESSGAVRVDTGVAADSPTVQIPEAVAVNASARTAVLRVPDPTAQTLPVEAPRSPAVPSSPAPAPAPAPAPVPKPAPVSVDAALAAAAARKAAAEQRAAIIAARSNSPTVRLDMRAAQPFPGTPPAGEQQPPADSVSAEHAPRAQELAAPVAGSETGPELTPPAPPKAEPVRDPSGSDTDPAVQPGPPAVQPGPPAEAPPAAATDPRVDPAEPSAGQGGPPAPEPAVTAAGTTAESAEAAEQNAAPAAQSAEPPNAGVSAATGPGHSALGERAGGYAADDPSDGGVPANGSADPHGASGTAGEAETDDAAERPVRDGAPQRNAGSEPESESATGAPRT